MEKRISVTFSELEKIIPERKSLEVKLSDINTNNFAKKIGWNSCRFDVMLEVLELFREGSNGKQSE